MTGKNSRPALWFIEIQQLALICCAWLQLPTVTPGGKVEDPPSDISEGLLAARRPITTPTSFTSLHLIPSRHPHKLECRAHIHITCHGVTLQFTLLPVIGVDPSLGPVYSSPVSWVCTCGRDSTDRVRFYLQFQAPLQASDRISVDEGGLRSVTTLQCIR